MSGELEVYIHHEKGRRIRACFIDGKGSAFEGSKIHKEGDKAYQAKIYPCRTIYKKGVAE